jgi:hypothetical protein
MTHKEHGYLGNPPTSTMIGSRSVDVHWEKHLYRDRAIVSRGTTCWEVSPLEPDGQPLVLKDSWRYEGRKHEGILLALCQKLNVQGIAKYVAHSEDDFPSVHELLGEALLREARLPRSFPASWYGNTGNSSPKRTSDFELNTGSGKRVRVMQLGTPQSAAAPAQGSERAILSHGSDDSFVFGPLDLVTSNSRTAIPNRVHTRVVLERGLSIRKWRTRQPSPTLSLLRCMRDAIRGHYSLLTRGKILHRDISINNIMMTNYFTTAGKSRRDDGFEGFLIDLDLALELGPGSVAASGAPERTGTFEFLSLEALEWARDSSPSTRNGFLHCYYDDLQSFFFVFLYICTESPTESEDLRLWSSDHTGAARAKSSLATDPTVFQAFLNKLHKECRVGRWADLLWKWRAALFPGDKRIHRTDVRKDVVMERIYATIDDAFAEAIAKETDGL